MSLSLDDFEWVEEPFDRWFLLHKTLSYWVSEITCFNGWRVFVRHESSGARDSRLHVDTLDAAKALAQILATQNMEKYQHDIRNYRIPTRIKKSGPPSFRSGVFKVG